MPQLIRHCLAGLLLMAAGLSAAFAHHGWRWTDDGRFELTARVEKASLGNPHGVLTMDADGSKWVVEVGQPWRNEQAGLTDSMLAKGATLTVVGKRSANAKEQRMKAERIIIDGKNFDLYPERLPDGKK
ncbi:hypothetical protein LPB72_06390 [Hydrogenophaga crassostreae]|nr:hypothetical protein LPB72_06390 [Hydrogenophaga crassostreae]